MSYDSSDDIYARTEIYTYFLLKSKTFYASCDILDHNYFK